MRKAAWACLLLVAFIGSAGSFAWAVERGLAGVRLGDMALQLLDRPGFGEPDYIGPLGTLSIPAPIDTGQAAAGAAASGRRSGPAGPGAARGAGRAGGGRRGGMGMGSAGMGGGMGGAVSGARAPRGGGQAGGMYWYYRRTGDTVLVLSLDPRGEVRAITLTGLAPYLPGRTTKGIGLTSGYMEIIAQYGYPDQTVTSGTIVELTYVDHGVRLTLENMRVTEMAIGTHIGGVPLVEQAPALEAAPPPAGLSVEELRGYL